MRIFNIIITTERKLNKRILSAFDDAWERSKFHVEQSTWSAINPVIHSLKELRKNTWDVERVDQAINWLKDNFEVK